MRNERVLVLCLSPYTGSKAVNETIGQADWPKIERELLIVFHQNRLSTVPARLIAPGSRLVGFGPSPKLQKFRVRRAGGRAARARSHTPHGCRRPPAPAGQACSSPSGQAPAGATATLGADQAPAGARDRTRGHGDASPCTHKNARHSASSFDNPPSYCMIAARSSHSSRTSGGH